MTVELEGVVDDGPRHNAPPIVNVRHFPRLAAGRHDDPQVHELVRAVSRDRAGSAVHAGPGDADAARRAARGARRARAAEDRPRLPVHVRLHGRRPRHGQGDPVTVVAGVEVSPDHFIGGERVASAGAVRGHLADRPVRARGGGARRGGGGRPRGPCGARRVPRLGGARAGRPRAVPAPAGRADRRERRPARRGRVRGHGDAAALAARAGDQARRAQLPRVRRPRARLRGARLALERDVEPRPADAVRARPR